MDPSTYRTNGRSGGMHLALALFRFIPITIAASLIANDMLDARGTVWSVTVAGLFLIATSWWSAVDFARTRRTLREQADGVPDRWAVEAAMTISMITLLASPALLALQIAALVWS